VEIKVYPTKTEMAAAAARQAADALRRALHARGKANVIAATGASQFEFLDGLVKAPGIDWSRTVFFHLDEYVGIPVTHPASFRAPTSRLGRRPLRKCTAHAASAGATDAK